jgi:hypothetical protein
MIPHEFNIQKEEGNVKLNQIRSLYWSFERTEAKNDDGKSKEEYHFNFRVIKIVQKFFHSLVTESKDKEPKNMD